MISEPFQRKSWEQSVLIQDLRTVRREKWSLREHLRTVWRGKMRATGLERETQNCLKAKLNLNRSYLKS